MELTRSGQPRVVVTGMGALTPLGDRADFWNGLKQGRSGIGPITLFDASTLDVRLAGEIDYNPTDYIDPKQARRLSRGSQIAMIAARMALTDAGLTTGDLAPQVDRCAVVVGTTYAGFELLVDATLKYKSTGRSPSPLMLVNGLPNMPGHYISSDTGAVGPLMTISAACASGTQAIGEAVQMIRSHRADLAFAGGVDCLIRDEIMASFIAMGVLATGHNDSPETASRPFEANRSGFVLGEAAGVLILESLEHALKRGALILAEVLGHASSSDAAHVTAPNEEGRGAEKAMRWALEDSAVTPADIDYINAHGTATLLNDSMEAKAIHTLFGDRAARIPVSSTKSMTGHCMGGAGAIEAIACIEAINEGIVPPTINYDTPDPAIDLDVVPNTAREVEVDIALSNSFGFGGQNSCVVIGKFE